MRVELLAAVCGLGLLASLWGAVVGGPQADGEQQAVAQTAANPAMKFDVVSFKRCETSAGHTKNTIMPAGGDSFGWECQSIARMLLFAFATDQPFNLSGQPAWVDGDAYSFVAKVAPEDVAAWGKLDMEVKRAMVREVLVDALKMKVHEDTTPRPVYDLEVANGGAKLTPYTPGSEKDLGGGHKLAGGGMASVSPGVVFYQATTMSQLAYALTFRMNRPVIDKTGLPGPVRCATDDAASALRCEDSDSGRLGDFPGYGWAETSGAEAGVGQSATERIGDGSCGAAPGELVQLIVELTPEVQILQQGRRKPGPMLSKHLIALQS